MAKATSFAEKAAKASMKRGVECPKCGAIMQPLLYISSEYQEQSKSWKFARRRVQVCKCTEKELYG
jgi:hypothetical protein